jgi:hypothetical protein
MRLTLVPSASRRILLALPLLSLLALSLVPVAGARAAPMDFVQIEKQIAEEQQKAAKAWLDLAHDLAARDLKAEAEDALARARALAPEHPALRELEAKVLALPGQAVPDATAVKRIARTREEVAKAYERMAKVLEKEQQDARYARFLVTALHLSPTKPRQTTLGQMAQRGPLLVFAEGHPFAGWLALPKGWKAGAPCSLLVVFEGEGLAFQQALARYAQERKDAPWAVLAPLTLSPGAELKFDRYFPAYDARLIEASNGKRNAFDAAGLPGLIEMVKANFAPGPTTALAALGRGAEPALAWLAAQPGAVDLASLGLPAFDAANLAPAPEAAPSHARAPLLEVLGPTAAGSDPATWLAARGLTRLSTRPAQGTGPSEIAAQQWTWLSAPR